jgi:cyclopropane fatty-acyl-phospholipid synthase-like methyltransferase
MVLKDLSARYRAYLARRAWNGLAQRSPRAVTATFDAGDWSTYWQSGERELDKILELATRAGLTTKGRAVEIGCGLGRITRPLASQFETVIGVDISSEMLAQARSMSNRPNIVYAEASYQSHLPTAADQADLVVAWTVFRHVSEEVFVRYLVDAFRALRPGGFIVFESQVRDGTTIVRSRSHRPFPEREYARNELEMLCSGLGFRWADETELPSVTPETTTLLLAWQKPPARSGEL